MAIAWTRVGGADYGVYLTKRSSSEDSSPLCSVFKAGYSQKGSIHSFAVCDAWAQGSSVWEEDHVDPDRGSHPMSKEDGLRVEGLVRAFVADWLESFGEGRAVDLLRASGVKGRPRVFSWRHALNSGLPVEIRANRMPDVFSRAEPVGGGQIHSFIPFPERLGHDGPGKLLEEKMRLFFELL